MRERGGGVRRERQSVKRGRKGRGRKVRRGRKGKVRREEKRGKGRVVRERRGSSEGEEEQTWL